MLENIKPGQTIRCTVTSNVQREDDAQTIVRLMRQDPDIKRRLKKSQEYRMRNLYVRSRGKRPWAVRQTSGKGAHAVKGATWTMTYIPQLANDFRAVSDYLSVEAA